MSDSRTTKSITYNLGERGRQYNGVDRNDVDVSSVVAQINSPQVQELVMSGDLYGYYGHEIRQRFGMHPPDTWVNPHTGEAVKIEAAIRTIKLSADNDGNVTAKHEFLDTNSGDYAIRLYKNNAGGFSSAINRKRGSDGLYQATGFAGFDYVMQPNYATNKGDGQLDSILFLDDEPVFDGVDVSAEQLMLNQALDNAIAYQLDSINTFLQADEIIDYYQQEAVSAQDSLIHVEQRLQKQQQLRKQRKIEQQQAIYDSLICESIPFEQMQAQWDGFLHQGTSDKDLALRQSKQDRVSQAQRDVRKSIFERIRGAS